ncbi:UNVERIFIED_CONTAM: hypothetical protein GTU68_000844, partial [Idotea baltica]|nr:hypothetical protein [Idotea baltica]
MEISQTELNASMERPKKKKSKNKIKVKDIIHSMYFNEQFEESFKDCWRCKGNSVVSDSLEDKGLKIVNSPFNCAFIPNVIQDTELLNEVSSEIKKLALHNKNNDLYKFKCTEDLKAVSSSSIQKLCSYIEGPMKSWIQKLTGLDLNDKVTISCSQYNYSDVLLCHDDELEGRRIAYVLYMVPSWKKKYGGSLDLFSVDHLKRPSSITERFYPRFNTLAFFEVSPVSFHQVAEVLAEGQTRLTINGWFHGEPIKYPPRPALRAPIFLPPREVEEHMIYSWLNPLYLDQGSQLEVRKDFQAKSEIQLSDFLKKKKYSQLSEALRARDLEWKWVGPPNRRHLEVANRSRVSDVVNEYLNLMQSEAMFLVLSQLTGLEFHHLAPQDEQSSEEADSESASSDSEPNVSSLKAEVGRGGGASSGAGSSERNGVAGPSEGKKKKKRRRKRNGQGDVEDTKKRRVEPEP